MSEAETEGNDKSFKLEVTRKAVRLYKQVQEEAAKRNLEVWNSNSYTQLAILAAFNDGDVSDTLDRYELAIKEGDRLGVSGTEIQNDDAYIGIAFTGLLLGREKSTK